MQNADVSSVTEKQASQMRTLFLAIILQAMNDYRALNAKYFTPHDKLTSNYFYSADFVEICEGAKIEPSLVRGQLGI